MLDFSAFSPQVGSSVSSNSNSANSSSSSGAASTTTSTAASNKYPYSSPYSAAALQNSQVIFHRYIYILYMTFADMWSYNIFLSDNLTFGHFQSSKLNPTPSGQDTLDGENGSANPGSYSIHIIFISTYSTYISMKVYTLAYIY